MLSERTSTVLTEDEKLGMEHLTMMDNIIVALPRISKKNLQRIIILLASFPEKENKYLKRIRDKVAKQVYLFASKCASTKHAKIFQQIIEKNKKEVKNEEAKDTLKKEIENG